MFLLCGESFARFFLFACFARRQSWAERVCAQCLLAVSSICMREPHDGVVDSTVVLPRQTGFTSALVNICEQAKTMLVCVGRERAKDSDDVGMKLKVA